MIFNEGNQTNLGEPVRTAAAAAVRQARACLQEIMAQGGSIAGLGHCRKEKLPETFLAQECGRYPYTTLSQ